MLKRNIVAIFLTVLFGIVSVHARIVYVNGPSFPVPAFYGSAGVDLDNDGTSDFAFSSSGMLCTADIPTSGCDWPFHVGATGTNEMLLKGYNAQAQPFGVWIGSNAPVGTAWSSPNFTYSNAGLTHWWWHRIGGSSDGPIFGVANPELSSSSSSQFDNPDDEPVYESGWAGALGELGVGYLGVRFYTADGLHYGWIRVRLPTSNLGPEGFPIELTPVVVDWAYETRTNTPIPAGAIGFHNDSVQFKVNFFRNLRDRPRGSNQNCGTGTFILTDNVLRCEVNLPGEFSSAEIGGLTNVRTRTKRTISLGEPLVAVANHTAFFSEITLSRPQIIQLLRGSGYTCIDDGDLIGRILPTSRNK